MLDNVLFINVDDYRRAGDSDDTAMLQRAVDAAQNESKTGISGCVIRGTARAYRISDTVKFNRFGGAFLGTGWTNPLDYGANGIYGGGGVTIRWAQSAPPDKPIFEVTDSKGVLFEGIRFQGNNDPAHAPLAGIRFLARAGDSIGSNEMLTVRNCYFGNWPWTAEGTHYGDMQHGILVDGINANNDEILIDNCRFVKCTATGVKFANTQSTWSHVSNSTFDRCGVGIYSAASNQFTNVRFNACDIDIQAMSTAYLNVDGYTSEGAKLLAKVDSYAKLTIDGARAQLAALTGPIVDAYPSRAGQAVHLRDVRFEQTAPAGAKIKVKPAAGVDIGTAAPVVEIRHCQNFTMDMLDVAPVDAQDRRVVIVQSGEINLHMVQTQAA